MNRLLALGGILAVVGGFTLLVMPVSHVPLLDANRQVLAESERQAYCAGEVMILSNGAGDQVAMDDCIASSTLDDTIDHRVVQPAWCRGILDNYAWDFNTCVEFVEANKYWPTLEGMATNAWNKRFPYPGGGAFAGTQSQQGDESRTGERETNDREGFDRTSARSTSTTIEGDTEE